MKQADTRRWSAKQRLKNGSSPVLAYTPLRPEPPPELRRDKDACAEWEGVVSRMPEGWFPRECWALLIGYCKLKTRQKIIDEFLEKAYSDKNEKSIKEWLKIERETTDTLATLSTKMRINMGSTTNRREVKLPDVVAEPGEERDIDSPWAA